MTDEDFEDLRRLIARLSEDQLNAELRVEALRVLLEARGLISHADYEAALGEMKVLGARAYSEGLESFQREERERQLERLRERLRRREDAKE